MSAATRLRKVVIRHGRVSDLAAVMEIERASFPTPWSDAAMRRELECQENSYVLVAEVGDRPVGYVVTWVYSGEAHVLNVAVAPDERGQGLGELLMLSAIEEAISRRCRQVVLEYRVSNLAAANLYRKLGFVPAGLRPRYYLDTGEDAIFAILDKLQTPATRRFLSERRDAWQKEHDWTVSYE
ncbi:MAG: ribosomal protein S18-alanine N-acetyltransferase [Armatimonadetes bacterium]|nr:ribosomal protein S18-alanine N-acetyltransferase [Armatimonadota bacterium]